MEVFCSTIVPTVNRPTLSRAIRSVLDQSFTEAGFEIIVVNDTGKPLPEEDWQHCERVRVINTNRRERSVARNTGAAVARGEYLHFLDDDDILLPGALEAFWKVAREKKADWIYGGWKTVDNAGDRVDEFRPELSGNIFALVVSGESIPLQASILKSKSFFSVGAFDPTITGVEDRDLGRRLALMGEIAHTTCLVASIRIGEVGSTTDWAKLAEDDRWGREKALSSPKSFVRLRSSINSSYWRGRVCRAYLASSVWNLKRLNFFTALSRGASGLVLIGGGTTQPNFWLGLREKIK